MDSADKNKNESAVIGTIGLITVAQNPGNCYSKEELLTKQLIDPKLNDGKKAGYNLTLTKSGNKCEIIAKPENKRKGNRAFYSTNTDNWKIHYSENTEEGATIDSPFLNTDRNY